MWRIDLSKQANKFLKSENLDDEKIISLVHKFISYSKGIDKNIGVKKLKG